MANRTEVLSTFERVFEAWPSGKAITSTRNDSFDLNHGLFYSPIAYREATIERPDTDSPPDEWIRTALGDFIRDEFGGSTRSSALPQTRVDGEPVDLLGMSLRLRDSFEGTLIYDANLEDIAAVDADPVARVYRLLTRDTFGHSANESNVSLDEFRISMRHQKVGCRLVLLGLPFRDQNPCRVDNSPGDVTLAEAIFLIRLHCTALAIYQFLPTGSDIVVLSDGELYAPMFGVEPSDAILYLNAVRAFRTRLNLNSTISIVPLKRLIDLYDAGYGGFAQTRDHIEGVIGRWLQASPDPEFDRIFGALVTGMRWNMNSRQSGASDAELLRWLESGEQREGLPSPDEMQLVALQYATMNLALRWHRVVAAMLPTTVRATMHPKAGQIALPRLGSCFPWNGVAIVEEGSNPEVHSISEAGRRGMSLVARKSETGAIVYYDKET